MTYGFKPGRMTLAANMIGLTSHGRSLLQDVTLDICPGEVVGLIGPNGAGKSTLLRVLAGLAQPASGQVTLGGRDVSALPPAQRGRDLAYLPQDVLSAPGMSVRDIVALGRLPHRRVATVAQDDVAIADAMAAVGVEAFAERVLGTMSGGERARVLLARALAVQAPVLLADEPIAALDPAQALSVMEMFGRLAGQGRSVAVALHDLGLAARFCTRLAVLSRGRLVGLGAPAEVLTDAMFAEVYGVEVRRCGAVAVPWSRVSEARRP